MKSIFTVHIVDDLQAAKQFYVTHFGLKVVFEADWYVHFLGGEESIQMAMMKPGHESVPEAYRNERSGGSLLSLVVEDATSLHDAARKAGLELLMPLRDEPWGQRHFMIRDPNRLLVDVIQEIPADKTWLKNNTRR